MVTHLNYSGLNYWISLQFIIFLFNLYEHQSKTCSSPPKLGSLTEEEEPVNKPKSDDIDSAAPVKDSGTTVEDIQDNKTEVRILIFLQLTT